MKYGYFDHNQRQISLAQWKALQEDEGYRILKRFRDQRVHIEAQWVGKVRDPNNYFPGLRPIFTLMVWNRNSEGLWVQDPRHGETFTSKAKLLQEYNDFLLEWTQTTLDENGELEEVGNELTAPPESLADQPELAKTSRLVGISEDVASVGVW